MKMMIVVVFALVAAAACAAIDEPIKTLRSSFEKNEAGYGFGFETENGIKRDETGEVKEVLDEEKKPHSVVVVRGSYTYTDKNGVTETVQYYADESGFHAEGPSIPVGPTRR